MIGYLEGEVVFVEERTLILSVGGVGYEVSVLPSLVLSQTVGDHLSLWIHTVVREDALDLYGFFDRETLGVFRLLIGVSGIGPKSALGIIGLAPISELARAIASGDVVYLTKVSGIGKKTAEKIVLELKDKMSALAGSYELSDKNADVVDALVALGYHLKDVREAVNALPKDVSGTQDKIRKVLQAFGK